MQGGGCSNIYFDVPYTRAAHRAASRFEPKPLNLLIHDDLTTLAPTIAKSQHKQYPTTTWEPHITRVLEEIQRTLKNTCGISQAEIKSHYVQSARAIGTAQDLRKFQQDKDDKPHRDKLPPGARVTAGIYHIAGIPIGEPELIKQDVQEKQTKHQEKVSQFAKLPANTQAKKINVDLCMGPTTKFGHLYKALPPSQTRHVTEEAKKAILQAYKDCIDIPQDGLQYPHPQEPTKGTIFQFLSPRAVGGSGTIDPTIAILPLSVASNVSSAAVVCTHPRLKQHTRHPEEWARSVSPTLKEFHTNFHTITEWPEYEDYWTQQARTHDSLYTRMLNTHKKTDIKMAKTVEEIKTQKPFTVITFRRRINRELQTTDEERPHLELDQYAKARIRHAMMEAADDISTSITMPNELKLTQFEIQIQTMIRYGMDIPYITEYECHNKCSICPPGQPLRPDHEECQAFKMGIHSLHCKSTLLIRRHNHQVYELGRTAKDELQFMPDIRKAIGSSTTSGTKIDLLLISPRHPPPKGFDITISHPLAKTHLPDSAKDARIIFLRRDLEKVDKHLPGMQKLEREYYTEVITVFGARGPTSFWKFWKWMWTLVRETERKDTLAIKAATNRAETRAQHARNRASAILARDQAEMIMATVTHRMPGDGNTKKRKRSQTNTRWDHKK